MRNAIEYGFFKGNIAISGECFETPRSTQLNAVRVSVFPKN